MSLRLNQKQFYEAGLNGSLGKSFVAYQAALWTTSRQNRELRHERLPSGQRIRVHIPRGGANGHYGRPMSQVMKPKFPHLRKQRETRGPRYDKVTGRYLR
jgi:hypothetical protein